MESVRLWFVSFEFNASVYYLVRELGYWITGYNTIEKTGPVLALITLCGIGLYWIRYIWKHSPDWSTAMLYVLTFYFFMATTVHPWYLASLLCLGIISMRAYPVVWTFLVYLSYSHYKDGGFQENYLLIATEYVLLIGWIMWESKTRNYQTKINPELQSSNP